MSILIKDMEMPKHGDVLVVREYNGKTYIKHEGHLGFEARLIELPPHGRLIDADKLLEKAYWDYNEATHDYNNFKVVSEYDIDDAPTVIEAED